VDLLDRGNGFVLSTRKPRKIHVAIYAVPYGQGVYCDNDQTSWVVRCRKPNFKRGTHEIFQDGIIPEDCTPCKHCNDPERNRD
jgi:hypothetical protein